jgi:hypothetical protein
MGEARTSSRAAAPLRERFSSLAHYGPTYRPCGQCLGSHYLKDCASNGSETAADPSSLLGKLGVQVNGSQIFERTLGNGGYHLRRLPTLYGSLADVQDGCQVFLRQIDGAAAPRKLSSSQEAVNTSGRRRIQPDLPWQHHTIGRRGIRSGRCSSAYCSPHRESRVRARKRIRDRGSAGH